MLFRVCGDGASAGLAHSGPALPQNDIQPRSRERQVEYDGIGRRHCMARPLALPGKPRPNPLPPDGAFVCIHDGTVDRTTDGHGAVAEMTLEQIKRLSASYGRPEFAGERVPTLHELAHLLPADVALALELKTDRFLEPEICRRLVDELRAANVLERTVVLSFHLPRVQAVRAVEPEMPIGGITLSRAWPMAGGGRGGPLWALLLVNPLYAALARRRGAGGWAPRPPAPRRRVSLRAPLRPAP